MADAKPSDGRNIKLWSSVEHDVVGATAWRWMSEVMATVGIPLNMVQKWFGHAQLLIVAIYAAAVGTESS